MSWQEIPQIRYEYTGQELMSEVAVSRHSSNALFGGPNEICMSRLKFSKEFDDEEEIRVIIRDKQNGLDDLLSLKAFVRYVSPTLLNASAPPVAIFYASSYDEDKYKAEKNHFLESIDADGTYELLLRRLSKATLV